MIFFRKMLAISWIEVYFKIKTKGSGWSPTLSRGIP